MDKPSEKQVHDALGVIVDNHNAKALNYAVDYAKEGLNMSGHELHVHCLHVLNNMTHWRGEEAKQVRDVLKRFTK